jgi:REP element-mobilizing transposase RayT
MNRDASQFRKGRHVVYDLHAHLVFVTKYRRGCITERVAAVLEGSFTKVCGDFDVILEEVGWEEDHAHLLISYPPWCPAEVPHSKGSRSMLRIRKGPFPPRPEGRGFPGAPW